MGCLDNIGGGYPTLQIGGGFYKWVEAVITEQRGTGGNTANFVIEVTKNDPGPTIPNLVCFVDGDGTKLFGGMVFNFTVSYQGDVRVITIPCISFHRFLRKKVIANYDFKRDFVAHINYLFLQAGVAINMVDDPDISAPLLDLSIVGEADIPDPESPLSGQFQFPFEGYLIDALEQLCARCGFYWYVDYGGWLNIIPLGEGPGPIATLHVVKNYTYANPAPFDILIPVDASVALQCKIGDDKEYFNLQLNYAAPLISTELVLGKNGTRLLADPESSTFEREDDPKEDIPADSEKRYFDILATTSRVVSVEITSA